MTAVLRVERLAVPRRLAEVSFEVSRGQVHALVGPNGAGKSTVVEAVLGLTSFSGAISLDLGAGGRVAVVPQRLTPPTQLPLTVMECLAAARTRWPVSVHVPREVRARAEQALESVGLAGFGPRLVSELSGGELRRVLLAHALAPTPSLLLLDEPEAGLDAASLGWLEEKLGELKQQQVTTLLVSHDASRVARLADAVTHLGDARA